jgi:hypothetical protein
VQHFTNSIRNLSYRGQWRAPGWSCSRALKWLKIYRPKVEMAAKRLPLRRNAAIHASVSLCTHAEELRGNLGIMISD